MVWLNILISSILLIFSIFIHAFATRFIMRLVSKKVATQSFRINSKEIWVSSIVFIMFIASFIDTIIWAFTYMLLGAIDDFEEALYFSIVSFTTLGYGDVTLSDSFRLLASIEAANGIIIFGWSTAIIMVVVQKLFLNANHS